VFLKYRPPMDVDAIVPRVRQLVAASIPGLSEGDARDKVSVVMTPSELPVQVMQWTTVGPFVVQSGSSGTLLLTLVILSLLAVAGAGLGTVTLLKRIPKFNAMFNKGAAAGADVNVAKAGGAA
jgi:type III secretion protein J